MNHTARAYLLMKALTVALGLAGILCLAATCGGQEKAKVTKRSFAIKPNIKYAERGDQKLFADLYIPNGPGPFPGVLMIHGGAWMSGSKLHMARHARKVADAEYVCVAINYRLAPKHIFPAQLDDCREALQWMQKNADEIKLDSNRIAGYGYSAGAHLACLMGLMDPEKLSAEKGDAGIRLKAVVAGGAPCDFRELPPKNTTLAYFLGGSRSEKPEVYRAASPAAFASTDDPPIYFFHGEKDALVPLRSPALLSQSLKTLKVRAELETIPNKGHIATFFDAGIPQKAIAFLNEELKGQRSE